MIDDPVAVGVCYAWVLHDIRSAQLEKGGLILYMYITHGLGQNVWFLPQRIYVSTEHLCECTPPPPQPPGVGSVFMSL